MKWLGMLHDIPLGRKLSLSILGTSILSVLVISATVMLFSGLHERKELRSELQVIARMVGDNSSAALVFGDNLAADETLAALKVRKSIESACLYSQAGNKLALFAEYRSGLLECPPTPWTNGDLASGLVVSEPIELRGSKIGVIQLRQNYDDLWAFIRLYSTAVVLAVLIALLLAWLLTAKLKSWLSAPVLELTATANHIAESGDYSLRADNYGEDEVGQLIQRFNDMLDQIEKQNTELTESHDHLEERVAARTAEIENAMCRLKEAQNQLIQTEKLAALGGLVAGVAHEINTPVGVGMTASSTLNDHTRETVGALNAGRLTKSDLVEYLDSAEEASDIILQNLGRAAELVRSFKQVAIDQAGLERRTIKVREYLQSVLTSLHPELKRTAHEVLIDCPGDLSMDTYPGALSQIMTNLIMNSVVHAFDNGRSGHMRISIRKQGGDLRLVYEDDGRGIAPEHLSHVYEPFFTTRRNEGGSGLGLHIVHNIVTQTLGGSIRLESRPGKGVKFVMMIPARQVQADSTGDYDAGRALVS